MRYNAAMHDRRRGSLIPLARGAEKELLIAGLLLALSVAAAIKWPGILAFVAVAILLAVFAVLLYFFRDPDRAAASAGDGVFLSPADGEVDTVEWVHEPIHLQAEGLRISIFMNLLDVHVNRAPIDGRVVSVKHVPGKRLQAFRPEAAVLNEHNLIGLNTRFGPVLVKQIAGIMARRVVCWVAPGDELSAGERVGIVKFGSRVDVYLPKGTEPVVGEGDRTKAGLTTIARWPQEQQRETRLS